MIFLVVSAFVLSLWCYYLSRKRIRPVSLPRLGKPGVIGYVSSALRFVFHGEECVAEGFEQFSGRPFLLPTLRGPTVILGPEHFETLRASDDKIFSQPVCLNSNLQLKYTLDDKQLANPYHIEIIQGDVNRAIGNLVPEIAEETLLAIEDTFKIPLGSESVALPLFHPLTLMVGRITNRALTGPELCRNAAYVRSAVHFAETLYVYATILGGLPDVIRPAVYFLLTTLFGGKKEPLAFIKPYVKKCLQERQETGVVKNTITELILRNAPATESLDDLAMRILNLNFASIHTTSLFATQAILELSILPSSDLDSIRAEVEESLQQAGGWNKAAVSGLKKLDSVLREVGRFYALSSLGMGRTTIADGQLTDGTIIPKGHDVSINIKNIHMNAERYPNPHVFDPFRFSKLRGEKQSDVHLEFTTVDKDFLPFAAGRHACPGRFFAAMELKIILAQLLLKYDFSLPPPSTSRPKNRTINATVLPDTKAKIVFRSREKSA